nr:3-dehydroquinate synthase [Allomuricauda sp.]
MKSLPSISQSFSVKYEYKLHFTEKLFALSNPLLSEILAKYGEQAHKVLFVVDGGVYLKHSDLLDSIEAYCDKFYRIIELTDVLIIPGGEESKNNNKNVNQIIEAINDKHICRHSFVVAIGGGAVIDMVGYAAATAHRGVKLIRVPTTVLSQNDAAVGVKNGINAFGKKNFIGTFSVPVAIINDFDFLKTLEQRDWISGIAEAIKVALIKDADFFGFITKKASALANRNQEAMAYLIHKCAEIHMQHIAQGGDPFERGSSRPLDFGHWAAHKLEQMTCYELRHGEAVAKGIALDITYSHLLGLIDDSTLQLILSTMSKIGFDYRIPFCGEVKQIELLKGIEEFREHLGGKLTITLITQIGAKKEVHTIDIDKMREAILLRSIKKEELSC